jgi:hypothetical protein
MTSHAVHFHIVAYKVSNGSDHRHLADFEKAATRNDFEQYLLSHGAEKKPDDDWYQFKQADEKKFEAANTEARNKKGNVYKLTDAPHVRDLPSLRSLLGTY